jgi:hypothetical protein
MKFDESCCTGFAKRRLAKVMKKVKAEINCARNGE